MKKLSKVLLVVVLLVSLTGCMSDETKDKKIFAMCDEANYEGAIELLEEYYGEKSEDKTKYDEVSEKLDVIFVDVVNEHVKDEEFDEAIKVIKDVGEFMNAGATRNSAESIIMSKFESIFKENSPETVVANLKKLEKTIEDDGLSYYKESVLEEITNLLVKNYMEDESYDAALEIMNDYYDYIDVWEQDSYDETILYAYAYSDEYAELYFGQGYEAAEKDLKGKFPQQRFEELVAEALNELYYYDQTQYVVIESVDMEYDEYSSDYATFYCYIKNNSGLTVDSMDLELIFYDANGNFIEDHDVYSYETCVPGEAFVEYSWEEVPYNLARYEFKILDVDFE